MRSSNVVTKMLVTLFWCVVSVGCVANDHSEDGIMTDSKIRKPIITIEYDGRVCRTCDKKYFAFYDDGYTERKISTKSSKGNLNNDEIIKLKTAIAETDFKKIQETKFTGICPTEKDGYELVFIFHMNNGEIRLPSCTYDLNKSYPVFEILDGLSQKYHKGLKLF